MPLEAAPSSFDAPTEDATPWGETRLSARARKASLARQASGRRRLVDPTVCDRDYDAAQLEFMNAMHAYKQSSGRMFPTWSEVLEVVQGLGYAKA